MFDFDFSSFFVPLVTIGGPAKFSAAQQISGITIDRPYTVNNGRYQFSFNVEGFYLANNTFSVLPSYYPQNGSDSNVYVNEIAYSLTGLYATRLSSVVSTSSPVDSTEIADFNNDGYSDIFIGDTGYDGGAFAGGQNHLLFGSATGFVDMTANLPVKLDYTHSATVADIDSDGDVDIFVGNLAWKDSMLDPYLLINDGQGNFTEQKIPNARHYTSSLFSDLDADGTPELILGGDNVPSVIMKYVDGAYVLSETLDGVANRVKTDVVTADLNHDGRPEILFSSTSYAPFYKGTYVDVYTQNDGKYTLSQTINVSDTTWNGKFYVTDVNDDTYLDVVSTGNRSDTKILINDGNSLTVDDTFIAPWTNTATVEMLDINGDGHLDFVYTAMVTPTALNTQSLGVFVMFG